MNKIVITTIIIVLIVVGFIYFSNPEPQTGTPEYVEEVVENEGLIFLDSPEPNDVITSPLTITGRARGQWYFEASFPVTIKNNAGSIIGRGQAEAVGDWMTEELVPFQGTITFTKPPSATTGSIVLEKSNPSGLTENAETLEIPVIFGE